jgi:hypothetical protein
MSDSSTFHFGFIPDLVNNSSIKLLKDSSNSYTLEYAIFEPKTVRISMHTKPRRRLIVRKSHSGQAILQQYVTALGLHPDYHQFGHDPISELIKEFRSKFKFNSESNEYFCGGVVGIELELLPSISSSEVFINGALEILTDEPHFALLQIAFIPQKIPKECLSDAENTVNTQIRFNIHEGKVEPRSLPVSTNLMKESGCFKFSIRVLIVEISKENLRTKLDRIKVFLNSHGLKTREYPAFLRSFSQFKSQIVRRTVNPSLILDGYSLMHFLTLPTAQFSFLGYKIVPNKDNYKLSRIGSL